MTGTALDSRVNGFAPPPEPPPLPSWAPPQDAPLPVPVMPAAGYVLTMPRREVEVSIGPEYPGFSARLWVNYPRRLQEDMRSGDNDRMSAALARIIVSHNGWPDDDGNVLPQPGATVLDEDGRTVYPFWRAVPDELAASLITLLDEESRRLPNSIRARGLR